MTLPTGDKVTVAPRDGNVDVLAVAPGPGLEGIAFQRFAAAKETFVVSTDPLALLGQTPRSSLFDVTSEVR